MEANILGQNSTCCMKAEKLHVFLQSSSSIADTEARPAFAVRSCRGMVVRGWVLVSNWNDENLRPALNTTESSTPEHGILEELGASLPVRLGSCSQGGLRGSCTNHQDIAVVRSNCRHS